MLLLINESGGTTEQITTEQFAEICGIPDAIYKKLELQPMFEVNPALTKPDKLNGGVTVPAGRASKPVIKIKHKGLTKVIRYCTTMVPDKINPRITTYEPKRLYFLDRLGVYKEFEEALFMYALPACKDSSIAMGDWHYSFVNREAKAMEITGNAKNIAKCWALINNEPNLGGLTDHEIIIVAKGIYAQNREQGLISNPSAKHKTVTEIRADLTNLAQRNAGLVLNAIDDKVNAFYGMVLDAVDKGIFVVKEAVHSKVKTWYWGKGDRKDNVICDITAGQNDFDALRSEIERDPDTYYASLNKAMRDIGGKENLANFIKKQEGVATESRADSVEPAGPTAFKLPKTYQDSVALMKFFNGGKQPGPKTLSAFWKGIDKEKTITADNLKSEALRILELKLK